MHHRVCAFLIVLVMRLAAPAPASPSPPASADTADAALLASARALMQAGTPDRAFARLVPAVSAREQAGDTASARYERLLQFHGEALGKGGARADEAARRRVRNAVALSRALHGPRSFELSTSLLNFGRFLLRIQQAKDARTYVDSAVALRRTLRGPDDADLAAALVVAGRAARENDDPDGAERATDEVYAIRARTLPADHLDLAAALNNRALARRMRGDFAGAYRDALAAVDIYDRKLPPTHTNRLLALKNLATTALFAGDPLGGVDNYRKSIAGYELVTPVDSVAVAQVYDELGLAWDQIGNYDEALAAHAHARALLDGMASPDSLTLRNALINHGETLRERGDLAGARADFMHGLAIETALALASSQGSEAINHDLGLVLRDEGKSDSAVVRLTRALELRRHRAGEDALASVLVARALAEHDAGALDSARADLARAARIAERTLGPDGILPAQIAMYQAQLEADAGNATAAFPLALASEATARRRARQILRYVPERQARAYAAFRPQSLGLVLSLAARAAASPSDRGRAWDCLIRSRGIVLDEFAARQAELRVDRDSTTAALAAERFRARQRIANLILRQKDGVPDRATSNALAYASAEAERAEWALTRRATAGAPMDSAAAEAPGCAALAAALPESGALVAYARWNRASMLDRARAGATYGAFVARPGRAPVLLDLGPAAAIDSLVRAWRHALSRGSVAMERAAGERLRRAAWDPLAVALAGARRIDVVPDGCLNDVSWYALPSGRGRLLDRDLEIRILSAEEDLLEPARAEPARGPVLVIGGADFEQRSPGRATRLPASLVALRGGGDDCAVFAARHFGALPFSAREAREVAARARGRPGGGNVVELTGSAAGEPEFIARAPAASWIHAATHGFFVDQGCRNRQWGQADAAASSAALDPLLYAGIALAGANRRGEATDPGTDGIVTADELALMDLGRVRGMVITGCDTGLGDYVTGEGVYGLRRALERAGVRSLTLALWPIDDQAAARWARAFYDGLWRRGMSPAAAHRSAMRQVRQELRAAGLGDVPRRWGGMVVSGVGPDAPAQEPSPASGR